MNKPRMESIADPADWLERHHHQLEAVLVSVSRRKGLDDQQTEEFRSEIHLHLVEKDYAVLRSWDGRSELRTFLYAVISRKLIDVFRARHGRWRPSKKAEALGETAVRLEQLLHQRRYSFEEAYQQLRSDPRHPVSRNSLALLASKLSRPPPVSETPLDQDLAGTSRNPEQSLEDGDEATLLTRVFTVLETSGEALEESDRLLLQLRFEEGVTLSRAARLLGQERPQVEKRLKQLLELLRTRLKEAGIGEAALLELLRNSS